MAAIAGCVLAYCSESESYHENRIGNSAYLQITSYRCANDGPLASFGWSAAKEVVIRTPHKPTDTGDCRKKLTEARLHTQAGHGYPERASGGPVVRSRLWHSPRVHEAQQHKQTVVAHPARRKQDNKVSGLRVRRHRNALWICGAVNAYRQ
jgi:hypothetical protein